MGLTPQFRLTANSADITAAIADRFRSLKLTDEAGLRADTLEICLADHDPQNPIAVPPTGAELELWLGYDGNTQHMGLFVADEVELRGWPGEMTIRARAAIYEETPRGKTDMQTQKSRQWADGTKLGAMVAKIAKEHGMSPACTPSLQAVTLPHFAQTEESDLSFLLRILRRYDAFVKPAGGKLVVARRGEGVSASGEALPAAKIIANQGDGAVSFGMTLSRRESPGTVVASWHSTRAGKRQEITVGSGDPVKQIRHYFPTASAAQAAAEAELERRKRGQQKLTLTVPGDPSLAAEMALTVQGFRPGVDGDWLTSRVMHSLDERAGYVCEIEAEKPNDTEDEQP